jgi:hypothetical protein
MKEVTVEELRERPEALIEALDEGEPVSITRDGKAIGTANPIIRRVEHGLRYPFRDIKISPLSKPLTIDPVDMLREDRDHDPLGKKFRS